VAKANFEKKLDVADMVLNLCLQNGVAPVSQERQRIRGEFRDL